MENKKDSFFLPKTTDIIADNVDSLVVDGIKHISTHGELFEARAGSGQQAFDVNYILTNPQDRVHSLRSPVAQKYLSRELLAYFDGSLDVDQGLSKASPFWKTLADKDNKICSNYGHYVFHQTHPDTKKTQYQWVIDNLENNIDSRKAFININQLEHKHMDNKDFPCTLGMQFFVRNNRLCCDVSSRSTDIYTGLPYDMAFFSLVNELVYKDVKERLPEKKSAELKLGYTMMKTNFTQIYDKTRTPALKLLDKKSDIKIEMPPVHDAQETLSDIYKKTAHTPLVKWIHENAKLD